MNSLMKLVATLFFVGVATACTCNSSSGNGRFCGQTNGMDGCTADHIYQCDHLGGAGQDLGPCTSGCITTPAGQNDHCA
ncbi:uncharacterized protein BX664DRAFT_337144 [Halteromyces radiatus]|uniref:uncharacterized protein n=1 Tax=Halteromyces radiatus TaxID=101107 RepID=UPI00221EBBF1|nr:uncharacterized protein BX664DRAFT_337144 [Halteromyces radiatus]KAI8084505.1 hypothetical protein BX664DRAFT_337144 [Halteromyces radiatus]